MKSNKNSSKEGLNSPETKDENKPVEKPSSSKEMSSDKLLEKEIKKKS